MSGEHVWHEQILPFMYEELRQYFKDQLAHETGRKNSSSWYELRLRVGVHPELITDQGELWLDECRPTTLSDLRQVLHYMSQSSYYALEQELEQAYLTLPGGHRVGMSGQMIVDGGQKFSLRHISSLNIRVARETHGSACPLLPFVVVGGRVLNTLIFSPPAAGKTTMIRDMARCLAGPRHPDERCPGKTFRVGIVDERSEIAACYFGVPQLDVGRRTDVMDHCPKAVGIVRLLRSMNPEVIITDEIGLPEDVTALKEILRCGVAVITTAHAGSLKDLLQRPWLEEIIRGRLFDRFIQLSREPKPGTIRGIWDADGKSLAAVATWAG